MSTYATMCELWQLMPNSDGSGTIGMRSRRVRPLSLDSLRHGTPRGGSTWNVKPFGHNAFSPTGAAAPNVRCRIGRRATAGRAYVVADQPEFGMDEPLPDPLMALLHPRARPSPQGLSLKAISSSPVAHCSKTAGRGNRSP